MNKKKPTSGGRSKKNAEISLVRSSAAEHLTFVVAGGNSDASVEMRYEDENIWLTQRMMATLYDVSIPAINQHLKRIFSDNELEPEATIKKYLIVNRRAAAKFNDPLSTTACKRSSLQRFKIRCTTPCTDKRRRN